MLTALALLGFSTATRFWALCLWAVPYGLGAGSIDAALNNYVALHYTSRHMSWLHCFWGVGTIVSPYVMSLALSKNTSFHSIAGKVYQFKETQIEQNLKSLILQYGIVKDKPGYIERLSYQNTNTEFDKQKHTASFNVCNNTIGIYSEEMTRVVLVPTKDANGKYYMGRTNVGIDELSVMATTFSDMIADNEKELMNNRLVMQRIEDADYSVSLLAQTDALILAIDKALHDLTVEAVTAGREYSDYKMNQCIAVTPSNTPLLNELKIVAVFAVLAYAAAMACHLSKKYPKA